MRLHGLLLLLAFLLLPRAGLGQCQEAKLLASDTHAGDNFGWSVSISGDWAIVGAYLNEFGNQQEGAAYFYERVGSAWIERQKVRGSDSAFGNDFGWSVAINENVAIVGAIHNYPQGIYDAGAAYVFERVGSQWVETAKIWASDAVQTMHFGWSVTVAGNRVLIGVRDDFPWGLSSGSAYIFDKVGSSWVQSAKLIANDGAMGDSFGGSVSLFGDYALVGALAADIGGQSNRGAAYVFQRVGTTWIQVQKLIASDGALNDYFGGSVALGNGTALISSVYHDAAASNAGAAYAFDLQPPGWVQVQKLLATDASANDYFGGRVALSGDLALASAILDKDNGTSSGSAYAFRRTGSTWVQIGKLLPVDGSPNDLFGSAIGLSGDLALGGAWADESGAGSAYVFRLAPDAAQYGHCATLAPCFNADDHGGCKNSTGNGAVLAACGSGSVALDELVIEATRLPPGVNGLFFRGGGQASSPYGDGLFGVSSGGLGIYRYPVQSATTEGVMTRGPGLVAFSLTQPPGAQILPGQTWNFQCWYRNPGGPCGSNFNFSSGLQAAFGP